jgi:uncharacterized repeat protein (TIGR03803 family)
MRSRKSSFALILITATLAAIALAPRAALAVQPAKIIYSFNNYSGRFPNPGLILDAAGNLYGTTSGITPSVGSSCGDTKPRCGTVFELSRGPEGNWIAQVILDFDGDDGSTPIAGMIFDSAGNLYGMTQYGGPGPCYEDIRVGCGLVFELTPSTGGVWTEKILYIFRGPDGAFPSGALTFDAAGNLYGATSIGGSDNCNAYLRGNPSGCGIIFQLTPTASGYWTEHVLHDFEDNGTDGIGPTGGLIFDNSGNIYGTTFDGGTYDKGTVFEMTPDGGGWNEAILYSFGVTSADGAEPDAELVFDANGNLYGETFYGGVGDQGTVFELKHGESGTWGERLLYQFGITGHSGNPEGGLVFDGNGNLYGTAFVGGVYDDGMVFELSPTESGEWQINDLHSFPVDYSAILPDSLTFDTSGNIYCPTSEGGPLSFGAVVEIRN